MRALVVCYLNRASQYGSIEGETQVTYLSPVKQQHITSRTFQKSRVLHRFQIARELRDFCSLIKKALQMSVYMSINLYTYTYLLI